MYNLNINVSTSAAVNNLLAVESACSTPRTPEILNSLIAMTNPLDGFNFNPTRSTESNGNSGSSDTKAINTSSMISSSINNDSCSSSGGSQLESPTSPPSVQHTCSQLIKAGLKLSIQSKRKYSADSGDLLDLDSLNNKKPKFMSIANIKGEITGSEEEDYESMFSPNQGLTPEDEERRRRRRERNKIAATKCRLKKREKTVNLVQESETLETQNIELKTQIQELETQRRRLVDMLSLHSPGCVKQNGEHLHHAQQSRQFSNNNQNQSENENSYHLLGTTTANDVNEILYNTAQHTEDIKRISPLIQSDSSVSPSLINNAYTVRTSTNSDIPLNYNNENNPNRSHHHPHQYSRPSIMVTSPVDSYSNSYNSTMNCHEQDTTGGQSHFSSNGLDNGCMA